MRATKTWRHQLHQRHQRPSTTSWSSSPWFRHLQLPAGPSPSQNLEPGPRNLPWVSLWLRLIGPVGEVPPPAGASRDCRSAAEHQSSCWEGLLEGHLQEQEENYSAAVLWTFSVENIPTKDSKRRWFSITSAETRCVSPAEEAGTRRGFGEEEDEGWRALKSMPRSSSMYEWPALVTTDWLAARHRAGLHLIHTCYIVCKM